MAALALGLPSVMSKGRPSIAAATCSLASICMTFIACAAIGSFDTASSSRSFTPSGMLSSVETRLPDPSGVIVVTKCIISRPPAPSKVVTTVSGEGCVTRLRLIWLPSTWVGR